MSYILMLGCLALARNQFFGLLWITHDLVFLSLMAKLTNKTCDSRNDADGGSDDEDDGSDDEEDSSDEDDNDDNGDDNNDHDNGGDDNMYYIGKENDENGRPDIGNGYQI